MNKLFRCIKNYFLCKKYPFWKLDDSWYDYNSSIYDKRKGSKSFFIKYSHTWYDDIPHGWKKAFGKQLSKEIKKVGKKILAKDKSLKWEDILHWAQIKEKYGELCLYASAKKELRDILDKYEIMSIGYCINCGKPARYVTHGWIEYYCEDCFEEFQTHYEQVGNEYKQVKNAPDEIEKEKKECRLTKKDIPISYTYHKTLSGKTIKRRVNYKKKYNIDFKELWNL